MIVLNLFTALIGLTLLVAIVATSIQVAMHIKTKNFRERLLDPEFKSITISRDDTMKFNVSIMTMESVVTDAGKLVQKPRAAVQLKVNTPNDILFNR